MVVRLIDVATVRRWLREEGIDDRFGTSASNYEELLVYYGLTTEAIKDKIHKMLRQEAEV